MQVCGRRRESNTEQHKGVPDGEREQKDALYVNIVQENKEANTLGFRRDSVFWRGQQILPHVLRSSSLLCYLLKMIENTSMECCVLPRKPL